MDTPETAATIIGTLISGVVATASGILFARKRLSKDSVDIAKDKAELDILTHLKSQRDEALEAKKTLQAEAMQADIDKRSAIARALQLEQELNQLRQKVSLLKQLVSRLSAALDLTKNQLKSILDNQSKVQPQISG